jgi:AraC-like DNA-binding protein
LSIHPSLLDLRFSAPRAARASLPASLFRTHALPPAERFATWRDSVNVFLDCRLDARSDAFGFNGQVESYLLDDLMLSRCTAGLQKFDRPSLKIARDDIDHYMIQLFLRGHTDMRLGRRNVRGARIVGFDLADVLDSVNADFDLLCVLVPRARLAPLIRHPDGLQGSMPVTEDGAGGLLANFLKDLFEILPALAPSQAPGAARALIELIATAFDGARFAPGDAPACAQRALELRARLFVKSRLGDRDLGPDDVASAMGLSRSALYRLFRDRGGIAHYIREQRLRRSFADLAHGRGAQIAQVAYRWGFSDPAHFARLFRERFDCTPSDARAFRAAGAGGATSDPRIGDRRYEEWIAGLA